MVGLCGVAGHTLEWSRWMRARPPKSPVCGGLLGPEILKETKVTLSPLVV